MIISRSIYTNISTKVLNTQRHQQTPPTNENDENGDNDENDDGDDDEEHKPILIVSSYGTDDKLIKSIKTYENEILTTKTFGKTKKPLFKFVKKTGANIGSKLSVLRSLALGNKFGNTSPCFRHGNCKCCLMIDEPNVESINGVPVIPAPGNCKTKNIIYLVTCRLCKKPYIGRTVQPLCDRMSGHRACFYKVLKQHSDVDIHSDEFSLGLHIANDHGCCDQADFNRLYQVQILENCSPSSLEKKEHYYIHRYKILFPIGLNKTNPFGFAVLG